MNKQWPHLEINLKGLSNREKEITYLLAKGKMRKEIADHCCIALDTVKAHLRRIMKKTGACSNVDLAVRAVLSVSNPKKMFLNLIIISLLSFSFSSSFMDETEWRMSRKSGRKNQRTYNSQYNYRNQNQNLRQC